MSMDSHPSFPPPQSTPPGTTPKTLPELDSDTFANLARFLALQDLANLALTSKSVRDAAYSDPVWSFLFRKKWPLQAADLKEATGARAAYLSRTAALQQFKFADPLEINFVFEGTPPSQILLEKENIYLSQGPFIKKLWVGTSAADVYAPEAIRAHNARITCMRLYPFSQKSLSRSVGANQDLVLATSSADHTIRLWCKGRLLRCFKGQNSPVTTLADQLLGDCTTGILASGGEDGTIRLWSPSMGKSFPFASLFGHGRPISSLLVSGHNSSLLVSLSKDAKMRLWDANAPSSSTSSSCVGMTSVSGRPVDMKCHGAMCYVGAGSSVTAIDLRTMKKSFTVTHPSTLDSLAALPSKFLLCTGGTEKALLWDIRYDGKKELADLDGHFGRVSMIHMDCFKVVTGGPQDTLVKIWETDTGHLTNAVECCISNGTVGACGLSAMAVKGCRIVTSGSGEQRINLAYFRDFSSCSVATSSLRCNSSKFWEPPSSSCSVE